MWWPASTVVLLPVCDGSWRVAGPSPCVCEPRRGHLGAQVNRRPGCALEKRDALAWNVFRRLLPWCFRRRMEGCTLMPAAYMRLWPGTFFLLAFQPGIF